MNNHSTPKDVFLHLGLIGALYVSIYSLISLVFSYINILLPDPLSYGSEIYSIISSTSALIILFPVFLILSWLIQKEEVVTPEKRNLKIKRWLISLTLFLAGIILVGDAITLVYSFLQGDLTLRFILKILTVLIVSGGVFYHYIKDLKSVSVNVNRNKLFAIITSLIVIITIITNFILVGTPSYQRKVRFDDQRTSDLQNIQGQIISYWQNKNKIPNTLADLTDSISGWQAPVDPETSVPYEYQLRTDPLSFYLCTTFSTNNLDKTSALTKNSYGPYGNQNWSHDTGHQCFDRGIDPELYRPYPIGVK